MIPPITFPLTALILWLLLGKHSSTLACFEIDTKEVLLSFQCNYDNFNVCGQ